MSARDLKIQTALETLKLIEAAVYADSAVKGEKTPVVLAELVRRRVDSAVRIYVGIMQS